MTKRRCTFYLDTDVIAGLQAIVGEAKAKAGRAGKPMRSVDGISDLVNAAVRAEIAKRKKRKKKPGA